MKMDKNNQIEDAGNKKSDYLNVNELIKSFDVEFAQIHESGRYDEIYARYI